MLPRIQSFVPAILFCLVTAAAQAATPKTSTARQEQRATLAFNTAKKNPLQLRAFLVRMPKGADLHMHLSGAIFAETFLKDAAADLLCVNPNTLSFTKNVGTTRSLAPQPVCSNGDVRAESVFADQHLYDALVDSFSMRSFIPSAGISAHDHFFSTFDRFGGIHKSHTGEWLNEVATRAAAQNEQYLEIMETPTFSNAAKLGYALGWPTGTSLLVGTTGQKEVTPEQLAKLRDALLAGGLRDEVATDRKELADAEAKRSAIENCPTMPQQTNVSIPSGDSIGEGHSTSCSVKIRFIYQVLRAFPPQQVFAQTLLGFELASQDPDVVGINFVQPEDAFYSMSEYHRQMQMLDYLHTIYPRVHITLHAGELAPGLVPPAGLRFHIREAVELGHAERIGHGADIMYEDNPKALLNEMADHHIMVEINLTSNDVILGIDPAHHPLPIYLAAHVPVAVSTDDEGVSRIDLTNEYIRAARDFNLSYADLKNMARTSLEHSFLPGPSLWRQPDSFTRTNPACGAQPLGAEKPTTKCQAFLQSSEKAAEQWKLEHRYQLFESTLP
ncbi:adenosine deaminase [Edaphobacter paludis]|uniref:adenosine deaminase n=1 Tax=Edaphobacter paludis TaxID=3035702 RepID=A0AAU7CXW7_9BACT